MTEKDLKPLIERYAAKYKLSPAVVYGVVRKESSFEPASARFEPDYRYIYKAAEVKPSTCSLATEITLQKTSFGLMQTMGGLLRELGYEGWLTAIVANIEAQLDYGCKHLAAKIKKYGLQEGIAAYNSGSPIKSKTGKLVNQEYVDKVLEFSRQYQ